MRVSACLLLALGLSAFTAAAAGQIRPGAHLQYDILRFDRGPTGLVDADGWRRVRLSLAGRSATGVDARAQYDFEADVWTDLFVRLPFGNGRLSLGQLKPPFSADALLSDSQSLLTENSAAGVFAPGRRLGVQYARGTLAMMLYGRDLAGLGPDFGVGVRAFRHGSLGDTRWHLGGSAALESPQDASLRLRLRPEAGPRGGSWHSSATIPTERLQRLGVEAGLQHGRLFLLGERLHLQFDADVGPARSADGGYLLAAWTLHGEPRLYSGGLFTMPEGLAGRLGQVELVARYSSVDLPASGETDLGQRGASLGLNAQFGKLWRVQLVHSAGSRESDRADANLWTLRLQLLY